LTAADPNDTIDTKGISLRRRFRGANRRASISPIGKVELERERLLAALLDLVAEHGYPALALEDLLDRAGLSRERFERHFAVLDDCFAELWERSKDEVVQANAEAFLSAPNWREGMRAAGWSFCRWLQYHPDRARVLMVEIEYAGETVRAGRDTVFDAYVDLIHLGREERPDAAAVPRARAEAVMGILWRRVGRLVNAGEFERLPENVPEIMYQMVAPYLGIEAAEEELARGAEDIARYSREEI
jgi:AcrR family transcriptional regulator